MPSHSTATYPHIAIVAFDTLGDLVLRQPLFSELLDRGFSVTVIARQGYDEILPFLDARLRTVALSLDPYNLPDENALAELDRAAAALAASPPDTIVAAAYNRTYAEEWLLHQFPEAESVGFALQRATLDIFPGASRLGGRRRTPLLTRPVPVAEGDHEAAKQRALFAAIAGVDMGERLPIITLGPAERDRAAAIARGLDLEPGHYAFACPAGTMTLPLKAWPAGQFADIAAEVWKRHQMPMLLAGIESESPLLDDIAARLRERQIPVGRWTGKAGTIGTLLGLIAHSRLYLGNDTGPMHCAGALGIPVVARFGGGHWPRFTPLAARAFTATQDLPCFGCAWQCWLDTPACMTSVPAATFVDGTDWILSASTPERRVEMGTPIAPQVAEAFTAAMRTTKRLQTDLESARSATASREPLRTVPRPSTRRPKVFVVTPSFNQGRYLRDTIESVLRQDYPNLEYFVCDGGSTDDSVEILRSYGDRVRWTSGPDGGQAAAISRAWAATDAEIVAWLNSDDTYLDGAISAAVDHLLAHPEAAMVYGQAWYTNAAGRQMRPYPTRSFDRNNLPAECFICQPAVFIRREVFQVVDLPDPKLRYCMDYDLWIRIAQHFEITSLDRFVATSRLHAANKTIGERGGAIREAVAVTRRHYGSVHPNWALMYTQHQLGRVVSKLQLPLATPRRRILDRLASTFGNRIEALPYEDGWAGPRTRLHIDRNGGGFFRAHIDFPVWPYSGVLRITAECDGEVLDVLHVRGPSAITLGFPLPKSSAPQATVVLEANRAFVPRHHYDWLSDSRILSFRLRSAQIEPAMPADERRRSNRVTRLSRALRFLPAPVNRFVTGVMCRAAHAPVEAEPDEHGWIGKRAAVIVVPDQSGKVTIQCECPAWPYRRALVVTVSYRGMELAVETGRVGQFAITFTLPASVREPAMVVLTANRTFAPRDHGLSQDWRPVSFRLVGGYVRAMATREEPQVAMAAGS